MPRMAPGKGGGGWGGGGRYHRLGELLLSCYDATSVWPQLRTGASFWVLVPSFFSSL